MISTNEFRRLCSLTFSTSVSHYDINNRQGSYVVCSNHLYFKLLNIPVNDKLKKKVTTVKACILTSTECLKGLYTKQKK